MSLDALCSCEPTGANSCPIHSPGKPLGESLLGKPVAEWTNHERWQFRWELPSLAVVACDGHDGIVLHYCGAHISMEIEEGGLRCLSDLGLDDAPEGISVWVGKYLWRPGPFEYPLDGDYEPKGRFRVPTDAEWYDIRNNRCPWNKDDWYSSFLAE